MTKAQRTVAEAWARVAATKDGELVIGDLVREFDTDNPLLGGSSEKTGANIGSLSVVRYVSDLVRAGRETPKERRKRFPAKTQSTPPQEDA